MESQAGVGERDRERTRVSVKVTGWEFCRKAEGGSRMGVGRGPLVRFRDEGVTSTGRAGSFGSLALTCSGGVGAARVPGRCSCRSPALYRVPGPSPLRSFSAPPYTPPAGLPGPPALSAPPRVRPLREQEPKREGSEDRSQSRGLGERCTSRGRNAGARVPTSTVPRPSSPGFWSPCRPALNWNKNSSVQSPGKGRSRI